LEYRYSKEAVEARRREILGANERLSAGSTTAAPEEAERAQLAGSDSSSAAADFVLEVKPGQNPLPALQELWKMNPTAEQIVSKVKALSSKLQWSESQVLRTIFGSLFDKEIKHNFYPKAQILSLFVPSVKEQKVVLMCVEKLCELEPSIIDSIASILNGFYEEEVLDEEILIKWYKHPIDKFDPKLSRKIRDSSKIFIDWLQNAEEEDDSLEY